MKKSNISMAISSALALTALVGCGGGSSQSSIGSGTDNPEGSSTFETTYAELEVSAMKGTLYALDVSVESFDNKTFSTQGSVSTDGNGMVTDLSLVSEPGYSFNGMYKITVSASENSEMICDAVACGEAELGETLTSEVLGELSLSTYAWIQANRGTSADGIPEGIVNANALTSMATQLVQKAMDDDVVIGSADALEKEQKKASALLLQVFGVVSDVNLFDLRLVSADSAANFEGADDIVTTISLINSSFAHFAAGETQASALNSVMDAVAATAATKDIEIAKILRQNVLDTLNASPVLAELGLVAGDILDISLPFAVENSNAGPVIEFTTPENVMAATITARASISEGESPDKAFDNDPATKWLDNGGIPSEEDPSWLQIQFPVAKAVRTLSITSANDADGRDPENFNLQASNDGETWWTLSKWSGAAFNDRFVTQDFSVNNTLAYTDYRINITKNKGDTDLMQIGEIELTGLITAEVDHTDAGGTFMARASIADAENQDMVFDNSAETKWLDNGGVPTDEEPAWVQVDFAEAKAVSSVAITSANDADGRDPENFDLQGSNDGGTTWVSVGEVSGAVFAERFERQVFFFGNLLAFNTYRFNVLKNKGDTDLMQIGEIELIGPELPGLNHGRTAGVTLSARASISEGEAYGMAFDDDANTKWLDNGGVPSVEEPSWVQADLPAPAAVNSVAITSANDAEGRDPENFELQASSDGETWLTLGQWSGVVFADRFVRQTFAVSNELAYSHYRVNITKNRGDTDLMQVTEIELIGPQYSSVNHAMSDGGVVSARAQISDGESGDKVFDGDSNTKWLDNDGVPSEEEPSWVELSLPEGVIVSTLAITSANDAAGRDPEDFNLQGSNDGVTWATIGAWKGQAFADRFVRQVFPMGNGRIFSYYRFNVTKNFGDTDLMQIGEIELIGPELPMP